MEGNAVVLTSGILATSNAKTTHGLLRGSARFKVIGIIDHKHAGESTRDVLGDTVADVPIFESVEGYCDVTPDRAEYLIIGVATKGGYIPDDMRATILDAVHAGFHIVNGLHDGLANHDDIVAAAQASGSRLIDIRKPRPVKDLHFWDGLIYNVSCPIVPVLGTDCAVGKRTTAKRLMEACSDAGMKAEMIFTGQTGWLQGFPYGFIFDSTPNDFVSGELEHAIVTCFEEAQPDVIFIEGQASLRNPSGPCGAEMLLSGNASGAIVQHPVGRMKFKGYSYIDSDVPAPADEIELIRQYGVKTIALTLSSEDSDNELVADLTAKYRDQLGIPVANPLTDDLASIVDAVRSLKPKGRRDAH